MYDLQAAINMRCPGWPCDTPHAIDPAIWRVESEKIDPESLAVRIMDETEHSGTKNICYTGGEPFMQDNNKLHQLTEFLWPQGYTLECFSNGSFIYPEWALERLHFMMDWKLEGSGEQKAHRAERILNAINLKETDGIKFVVTSYEDLHEALALTALMQTSHSVKAQFWVGAAWGHITEAEIVDFMKKFGPPWKLNVQQHKFIYPPDARGV